MPSYDYRCNECGHEFEVKQKMTDEPIKHCPHCSKEAVQKVIKSTGGFQLKGSGWFKSGGY